MTVLGVAASRDLSICSLGRLGWIQSEPLQHQRDRSCGTVVVMPADIFPASDLDDHICARQSDAVEDPDELRVAVLTHLENQGFHLNDNGLLMEAPSSKDAIRQLHAHAVQERRDAARKYLAPKESNLLKRIAVPQNITVERIRPRLTLIENRRSADADLWRWASLHWSIPVSAGYGRRLTISRYGREP